MAPACWSLVDFYRTKRWKEKRKFHESLHFLIQDEREVFLCHQPHGQAQVQKKYSN